MVDIIFFKRKLPTFRLGVRTGNLVSSTSQTAFITSFASASCIKGKEWTKSGLSQLSARDKISISVSSNNNCFPWNKFVGMEGSELKYTKMHI